MLNSNEFNITISQEGLDTHIHFNKEKGVRTISANGLTLIYDPERFERDVAEYAAEQLKAHHGYHELVTGELSAAYEGLCGTLGKESDIERAF